jgi:hypothetical protein
MRNDGKHECLFMMFCDWASDGFTAASFIPLIHGCINPIRIVLSHACSSISPLLQPGEHFVQVLRQKKGGKREGSTRG